MDLEKLKRENISKFSHPEYIQSHKHTCTHTVFFLPVMLMTAMKMATGCQQRIFQMSVVMAGVEQTQNTIGQNVLLSQ